MAYTLGVRGPAARGPRGGGNTSTGAPPSLRNWAAALALGAAILGAAGAKAETYPARPVRLVIPFPAAGGADFMGREMARRLAGALNQPFVVDNRAGASGIIGSSMVATAPADGYTLLLGTTGTHSTNYATLKNLAYDPVKDFATVSIFADAPFLLCVNSELPVNNLRELISYARANPGKLTYGSAGIGSSTHLGFEAFKQMARVQIVHVPYKGLPPAMMDTLAGHISMTFDSIPSAQSQMQSKKLRIIGSGGAERSNNLKDIPTLSESGLPGYTLGSWYGIFAPAETPKEIVARLNMEINRILQTPDMQERLAGVGATAMAHPPEEARRFLVEDIKRWKKIADDLNIKVEQ